MLYHDQSIPQISQTLQSGQQFIVVPLVQADTGLVQNITHAHQPGTDLGGQSDALSLSAGQRGCRSGKGQILQTYIGKESHPGADLLQDLSADQLLLLRQFHLLQISLQFPDGHGRDLINVLAAYRHRQRFLLQSHPLT